MKLICTDIEKVDGTWRVTITNGNGLRVRIEGMETKRIAMQQARDRKRELKKAKLI